MPANVPETGMRNRPATVVPGMDATARVLHSVLTSTRRPLASVLRSCVEGAQLFLSPVRADAPNFPLLPEYLATTGQ